MTTQAPATRRTMVADFDSVRQRELVEQVGPVEAFRRLTAQLRTADLLSEELVVTDAQILDGIFFLLAGPSGIADLLGRSPMEPLPLVVTVRADSLDERLEAMREAADFEWSAEAAARHAEAAGERRATSEMLDRGRVAWLDAARAGTVMVRSQVDAQFDVTRFLGKPTPPGLPAELAAELHRTPSRSTARALIDQSGLSEGAIRDAHRWWQDAYAAALASQHDATWLTLSHASGRGAVAVGAGGASSLELNGSMVETLAVVPPAVYSLVAHRAMEASASWSRDRSPAGLRDLAWVVRETVAQPSSWRDHYLATARRLAILAGLALVTTIAAFLDVSSKWAAVPLVAALLAGIPWGDVSVLISDRPSQLRAVIHLPAPSGGSP